MKKMLMMFCAVLVSICSLAGCGKEKKLGVHDGAITNGDEKMGITEWRGYEATHEVGEDVAIEYYLCPFSLDECPHNMAGVLPENMTKHKKAKYYQTNLETYIYMYLPYGDGYIEGNAIKDVNSSKSLTQVVNTMYEDMCNLVLNDNIKSVNYEDEVELLVDGYDFKARPDEIVIPGLIRVKKDDGSMVMQSTTVIGEVTVGTVSNESYDYYKYKDTVIQAGLGTDIEDFIRFLP